MQSEINNPRLQHHHNRERQEERESDMWKEEEREKLRVEDKSVINETVKTDRESERKELKRRSCQCLLPWHLASS